MSIRFRQKRQDKNAKEWNGIEQKLQSILI